MSEIKITIPMWKLQTIQLEKYIDDLKLTPIAETKSFYELDIETVAGDGSDLYNEVKYQIYWEENEYVIFKKYYLDGVNKDTYDIYIELIAHIGENEDEVDVLFKSKFLYSSHEMSELLQIIKNYSDTIIFSTKETITEKVDKNFSYYFKE